MYPFRTKVSFYGEEFLASHPPRSWRSAPFRLSATTVSIYSQLPTILEAVPPSAVWGNPMLWWEGPNCHGPYAGTDYRLHAQHAWRRSCRYTTALEKTDYCRVSSPITTVTRLLNNANRARLSVGPLLRSTRVLWTLEFFVGHRFVRIVITVDLQVNSHAPL